jgi:predicted CXXCH cytochrome family protein
VFEHAPSRDGCVTCHDPHGSSNERMLVVKTPMLCQRCHVATRHPSTIYDQALINTSVRVYARSCVTCHTNMHGSNHPSGRFFIR